MEGYFNVPSGLTIENKLILALKDELDQYVSSDDESICSVSSEEPARVSKNTKVRAKEGEYVFDDFIVTHTPNTRVNITFMSDAIDAFLLQKVLRIGQQEEGSKFI